MEKITASFKYGKISSKTYDLVLSLFIVFLLVFLIFPIVWGIKREISVSNAISMGLVILFFLVMGLWLLISNLSIKKKIKIWLEDAIKVEVFVECTGALFWPTAPKDVIAHLTWEDLNLQIQEKTMQTILYGFIYTNVLNKTSVAYYSPKYEQLLFYEETKKD